MTWLPQLVNMLAWWQWLILAAVPPAIIALYFLKLKRQLLEVPSTYLWHRSIEDLYVNTIWQRLRRNLLLFLQLLLIFLAMLALMRPGWKGSKVSGDRFIFMIDNSASMQATDGDTSRLDEAKRGAGELIDQMNSRDAGMIISFSDSPRIQQMFTHSRGSLRRALEEIEPTQRSTSLSEALKVASGLANPGRTAQDVGDVPVADPMPASLYIFSDGKFPDVSNFSLGNLEPVYTSIGSSEAANVGIVNFNVRRHESNPELSQAFARLENFGLEQTTVSIELKLDGQTIDADELTIPAGEDRRVAFEVGLADSGVLELRATTHDDLACDDVAWAVVNPPSRAKVLLVTHNNKTLEWALSTDAVSEIAEVTVDFPSILDDEKDPYRQKAAVGDYDLIIYDRCRPKEMPQANTLFIGSLPSTGETGEESRAEGEGEAEQDPQQEEDPTKWRAGPAVDRPAIIDVDPTHPLMQWIEMSNVDLAEGTPLLPPRGATSLIDAQWLGTDNVSHVGSVFAVAPREEFEDAVTGFVIVDERPGEDGQAETFIGTDWPIRSSFPIFMLNLLRYSGGGRSGSETKGLQPGQPVTLESPLPDKSLEVRTPSGEKITLKQREPGKFNYTRTSELGVYDVRLDGDTLQHFAVNLFSAAESDLRPSPDIKIGRGDPIKGQTSPWETIRRELWKWLLLAGLGILLLEWYIYNRRVYL